MRKNLNIKQRKSPNKGSFFGLFGLLVGGLPMLMFGDSTTFSAAEGYANSGSLNDHPNWNTTSNDVFTNSGQNKVNLLTTAEAVYFKGEPANAGDVYTAQIDFDFTAATSSNANSKPNQSILNVSLYGANSVNAEKLKVGLMRGENGDFHLKVQNTWDSSLNVVSYGGEPQKSGALNANSIGISRNSDLESDLLRLVIKATRGVGQSEWKVRGELWNMSVGSGSLLSDLDVTGVAFSTNDNIRAGFGSGHDSAAAFFSNRSVYAFEFTREDRSFPVVLAPAAPASGFIDLNNNGIADHTELIHPEVVLIPDNDSDGDGIHNRRESLSGTNPFDANSVLRPMGIARDDELLEFSFSSVPGVRYRLQHSTSMEAGTWSDIGDAIVANGSETTISIPSADLDPKKSHIRARVLGAVDSDGDGLVDSLERYLGFDPDDANSVRSESDGGDFAQYARLMSGSSADAGDFNGSSAGIPSPEQASRFFSQATFGGSEEMIRHLRSYGENAYEKWIDEQLDIPATLFEPYLELLASRAAMDKPNGFANNDIPHRAIRRNDRRSAVNGANIQTVWVRQALFAPDRLRQRVAWALSQILVTASPALPVSGNVVSRYYDLLLNGALGSYEDLLYEVSITPLMGQYLSSAYNVKANPAIGRMPDENFAREIMQLFSIGLWELNMDGTQLLDNEGQPIPTYTNDDIMQVARVFTGLVYVPASAPDGRLATHPMLMNENSHDKGDAAVAAAYNDVPDKIFLQSNRYQPETLGPGGAGYDEIRATVKILINHPSCAPFISKNLIQHMVTSNPSPEYIERVANVFATEVDGKRGNLGLVVKAILLDPEARSLNYQLADRPGRLKAPMLRLVSLAKAFRAGEDTPALHDLTGIQFWQTTDIVNSSLAQAPFHAPSVFNFYQPGYSQPGEIRNAGLLSPEFQILNSFTAVKMPNLWWRFINEEFHFKDRGDPNFALELAEFEDALDNSIDEFLDRINILLCHGRMGPETRAKVRNALQLSLNENGEDRVKMAIYLTMISQDAAILR